MSKSTSEKSKMQRHCTSNDYPLLFENTKSDGLSHRSSNGRFCNPWHNGKWSLPMGLGMLRFAWDMQALGRAVARGEFSTPRPVPVDLEKLSSPPQEGVNVCWIGHATSLVQQGGLSYLTDPVWSQRASLVQFAGPKRYVDPPITLDALVAKVPIDFVVISHNHYDHLDINVVKQLGNSVKFFVPLGLKDWFVNSGVTNVVELDWWQGASLPRNNVARILPDQVDVFDATDKQRVQPDADTLHVVCSPAQHWTKRSLFDDCATLWGSWSVITKGSRTHFCGDTGCNAALASDDNYGTADGRVLVESDIDGANGVIDAPDREPEYNSKLQQSHFAEIGARLGPFDVAMIPIGAYEPRRVMRMQHISPEEAVAAHVQLRARTSVGVHWGTFVLTTEPINEPPLRVAAEMKRLGLPLDAFVTQEHGETRFFEPVCEPQTRRKKKHKN